jgi:hypothetical protein
VSVHEILISMISIPSAPTEAVQSQEKEGHSQCELISSHSHTLFVNT